MNRRVIGGTTVGILLISLLALWGAWTVSLNRHNRDLALQLEAERQRNYAELIGHVESMRGVMGKSLAAGSPRQNMLYMGEVYRRASLASANFMALPIPGQLGASTGKFLNQVGDFSYSVARGEAAGRHMDPGQREELARLYTSASNLTVDLQKAGRQAVSDNFRWVSSTPKIADLFSGWRPALLGRRGGKPTQDQPPKALIPAGLDKIGPQMDRMPQLVYDGPFSDHLEKRTAAMRGPAITEAEAQQAALTYLSNPAGARVVQVTQRAGLPPAFSVRMEPPSPAGAAARGGAARPGAAGTPAPRHTITVDIAQEGGHLVSFVNARPAGKATLNLDQAKEIGRTYLEERGYRNMEPTYGEAVDGFATVQYVHRHNGVLVYPDQIKVRVALDNGEVVGADAHGYVMSHRDRGALEVPAVTQQQAARALNPALQVQRTRLTLIPTEAGDGEVLAYEFLGTLNQETYLVYVNAKTGEEERILQMVTTPNGTLAL